MPRRSALLPLSRDHHDTLVLARRIARTAPDDLPALQQLHAASRAHRGKVLQAHFAAEETLCAACGDCLLPGMRQRLLDEHAELDRLASGVACPLPLAQRCQRFGDLVTAHIRFEERQVFPLLQPRLPPDPSPSA